MGRVEGAERARRTGGRLGSAASARATPDAGWRWPSGESWRGIPGFVNCCGSRPVLRQNCRLFWPAIAFADPNRSNCGTSATFLRPTVKCGKTQTDLLDHVTNAPARRTNRIPCGWWLFPSTRHFTGGFGTSKAFTIFRAVVFARKPLRPEAELASLLPSIARFRWSRMRFSTGKCRKTSRKFDDRHHSKQPIQRLSTKGHSLVYPVCVLAKKPVWFGDCRVALRAGTWCDDSSQIVSPRRKPGPPSQGRVRGITTVWSMRGDRRCISIRRRGSMLWRASCSKFRTSKSAS